MKQLGLILLLALPSLSGCATKAVKLSREPEPPLVKCEQGKTPDGPDWPEDWVKDGPAFAIAWLGIATEERQLRAIEHECLTNLRQSNVIK